MSKGSKKKVTVKTLPGEAVVVAPIEVLTHIIKTYQFMSTSAETEEEEEFCKLVALRINEWIKKTYHSESDYQDEEW
jgi:hypothetical protein